MPRMIAARALVAGDAEGLVLRLAPLSFWGGFSPEEGRVIEPTHPQFNATLAGRVVVMPLGRGSSSSSNVLAEAIRLNTAPAAILLRDPDLILATGAWVAAELYGKVCPILLLQAADWESLPENQRLTIRCTSEQAEIGLSC